MTDMGMNEKQNKLVYIRKFFFITLGAWLYAIGIEKFLVPNHIIDGGITGISIIASQISHWSLSIFLIIFNIPFLFLGYKQLGKTFAIQSSYGILMAALFTELLHHSAPATNDSLLAAVFGGIILGIGVGIVLRSSGSLDGTEILSILISSKTPFSVGQIVMFFNFFILSSAGFVFNWNSAMYSLITYFVAFKMMDIVIAGFEQSKSVWIISEKDVEIGEALLSRLGRSVTYLQGEGSYSGEGKKVIFCIINRLEEAKLKAIVDKLDPNAFLAVGSINDVKGGQFKKKNIH